MQGSKLTLEAPPGRNGAATVTVTARLGDTVLACEQMNLTKSKARADFAAAVCDGRPGIDRAAVEAELLKLAAEQAASKASKESQPQGEPDYLAATPVAAKEAGRAMLESPDLMKHIVQDVAGLGVAGERELAVTLYLVGTSRLLPKPLAAIVQGPSSSGKSYVVEKVARMFPPEAVVHATQMTPQALFHMLPGALVHRWVVAGERSRSENDDTAEATRALREMISSGRLVKLMPTKRGGEIETVSIEQEGPIAYVESTTLSEIFDEDRNRCLLLNTDEQSAQTRRILDRLAEGYMGENLAPADCIVKHYAAQRLLAQRPVVVPFAQRVGEHIDPKRVEARRAFPQLMSMIQAAALLHQFQREADGDGRLIATADDYKLARHLLLKPIGRLLGGALSDPAARFLERLQGRFPGGEPFTKRQAAQGDTSSRSSVYGWLSELADADLVEQVEPGHGRVPGTWRVSETAGEDTPGAAILPAVEKLFPG